MGCKATTVSVDRQKELANCNFVKTILMLIVVIYHCMVYWTGTWFVGKPSIPSAALATVSRWMNSFHVYGFILVSGYLFFFLRYEAGKYLAFWPFATNKAKRLLIPYVTVALGWVIPFGVCLLHYGVRDIITHFVLGTSPSQLWFLLMLFCVFVLFYPLSGFFKEHHIGGAAVVMFFYAVGFIGQLKLPNVFQIFRGCSCIPLFWLGFKIRQCGSQWLRKIPTLVWLIADIALFAVTQYLSRFNGKIFTLLGIGLGFVLNVVGALMAFVVLQKIADRVSWKQSRVFNFLGKHSMTVYLFHQQVVYLCILLLNGAVHPYLHVTINFVVAMGISLCISVLLMKCKWTRILIGEK